MKVAIFKNYLLKFATFVNCEFLVIVISEHCEFSIFLFIISNIVAYSAVMSATAATLSSCKDFWQDFDLRQVQHELDNSAGDIANKQDEADVGRKKLVKMSKEFKSTATDDCRKTTGPLLKAFQGEIDALSKRSKAAETTVLTIYKKLSEAPDPTPILSQALSNKTKLSQLTDLEIEKRQLRETLEQYNIQFAAFKEKEIELEELKEKMVDYDDNLGKSISCEVDKLKTDLEESFSMKEGMLKEMNTELSAKVMEQTSMIESVQRSLEQTESELFECKVRFEEELQTKSSEIDLYLSDLDTANQRAEAAQRVVEQFQHSSKQEGQNGALDDLNRKLSTYELEITSKDIEINSLVQETQDLRSTLSKVGSEKQSKLDQVIEELELYKHQNSQLISELETKQDYDEVKRELSVLKIIEFGESNEANVASPKNLEILLLDKNRVMQTDNSNLRLEVFNLQKRIQEQDSEITTSHKVTTSQQTLVKQLEHDLSQLQAHRVREDADGEPSKLVDTAVEPTSETIDMLAIVTSQRERFKAKTQLLESDHQQLKTSYAVLQQDNVTLRNDNMKLYERIRFLQTVSTSNATSIPMSKEDDLTSKYSSQYEANIDPFNAFNKRERHRKYGQLNSAERVVLNFGKVLLSEKWARHFIFFYTIALHMLVSVVLYKFASVEECVVADCNDQFAQHMAEHHP